MQVRDAFILSAICLLANYNMANAANNIISGNNISNKKQISSTVVRDPYGRGNIDDNFGPDNVITGNNNHDYVESNIRSTVNIDKNGNRQTTYDVNQNGYGRNSGSRGSDGRNVISGNGNRNNDQSSIRTSFNGRPNGSSGSGGRNVISGNGNNNNVQTSISKSIYSNAKDTKNVTSNVTPKPEDGSWQKVKNFFG